MANKALKGLTIKIGGDTSELSKALDGVEKQGKSFSSELGQINKLLKFDPKNTELLTQKQKVLADAIKNTEKKLETLREAEKEAQEQFERGEISEEQYRALQREIIETENKLKGYQKAAKETSDALEELEKDSDGAADGIDETGDAAEDADDAVSDLGASAAEAAKNGLTALVGAATAAVGAIIATAEASREYRTAMGKLTVAFEEAGHSAEATEKTYKELQSVLGETDQAVEAAAFLAKLCDTEEELADWTEIATGVYATFGASLPIEGLTEAANETAKVGALTGSLADALNWAGVNEEAFQAQLDECSNEQERQQLITKTLTKLYKNAATQYKETNKEVIRANKANEDWNATLAKVGKAVEPVVTDVKELGIALLEDAGEPLEDIANFIRTKLLPAIKEAGTWAKSNLPTIAAGVAGVTVALVAYKVAVLASELATKGLTVVTVAQAAAQKALNVVMAAGPWGLVTAAVLGVTAAVVAFTLATKDAQEPVDILTEEERKLMAAADEAAEAFRNQKKATDDALRDTTAQMDYVHKLASELDGLAKASGHVEEKDRSRAQFILNELNEALGTEYTMTGNVIKQYKDLQQSVQDLILAKTANSLVEASNADYVAAIQNEADAMANANLKYEDYQNQLTRTQEKEDVYLRAREDWLLAMDSGNHYAIEGTAQLMAIAEEAYNKEKGILDQKKTDWEVSAETYRLYQDTIGNYEAAQTAVLEGNYQKAVDILAKKGGSYGSYSDKVDKETAKVLDTLYKEAIDAGLKAELTKKNFENGVDGYTKQMVAEAEANYSKAMGAFSNAYADAEGVGEDMTDGMTTGAENKRPSLISKARSLVSGFLAAARQEADSHSPSRKAIKLFEDIGAGAEIGIDNKTDEVETAARKQAAAVMNAYKDFQLFENAGHVEVPAETPASAILEAFSEPEATAQRVFNSVTQQQAAHQATSQTAATTATAATKTTLDKILDAIEKGQVLLLDGDALVGGTAERMNQQLGMLQVLSARGAK